jgi:hypothetical protein
VRPSVFPFEPVHTRERPRLLCDNCGTHPSGAAYRVNKDCLQSTCPLQRRGTLVGCRGVDLGGFGIRNTADLLGLTVGLGLESLSDLAPFADHANVDFWAFGRREPGNQLCVATSHVIHTPRTAASSNEKEHEAVECCMLATIHYGIKTLRNEQQAHVWLYRRFMV